MIFFDTPRKSFDGIALPFRRARRYGTIPNPPRVRPARLRELVKRIEPAWITDEAAADAALHIAVLARTQLVDIPGCLDLLLRLVAARPHRSDAYHEINQIYHHDASKVLRARLLDNALAAFGAPKKEVGANYYAMSCAYLGWLYGRLGLLMDARRAFALAARWRDSGATATAEYGLRELDFLASTSKMNPAELFGGDSDAGKPRLLIGTVLFGREYCDLFEACAVRTLFGASNLAAARENWCPALVVFAPKFDLMRLRLSQFLARLRTTTPISFVPLPPELIENYPDAPPPGRDTHPGMPYAVSSLAQVCMAELARRSGADLMIAPPDAVFSAAALPLIARARRDGFEAVLTPGLRLDRQAARKAIDAALRAPDGDGDISPRRLTGIALETLHKAARATFATDEKVTNPGQLIWPAVHGRGLRVHAFQLHPIFVSRAALARDFPRRLDSIDGAYIATMFPTPDDRQRIRVLTEGDDIAMYELSPPNVPAERQFEVSRLAEQAGSWLSSVMQPIHFWLFSHPIRIGAEGADRRGPGGDREATVASILALERRISRPSGPAADVALASQAREQFEQLRMRPAGRRNFPAGGPAAPGRDEDQPARAIFSIVVWGRQYVENFLNICLPSMLAPGNLLDLPGGRRNRLVVHTRPQDRPTIAADPGMRRLAKQIDVVYVDLRIDPFVSKYNTLSRAQSDCVQMSREFDVIVFLYSDFVWARGGIAAALARLKDGYEAIVAPVPPLVREEFVRSVLRDDAVWYRTDGDTVVLDFKPRELVGLGKRIMHPMMRDNVLESERHTGSPAYMLWTGPNGDYVIRCFHAHPVALRVKHRSAEYWREFSSTLDEFFFPAAYAAMEKIYMVPDSDELAIVSLTEAEFPTPYLDEEHRLDSEFVVRWAEACAAPTHKLLFGRPSVWHASDIDPAAWAPALARSEAFARGVAERLLLPDLTIQSEDPLTYATRLDRNHRCRRAGAATAPVRPPPRARLPTEPGGLRIKLLSLITKVLPAAWKRSLVLSLPPKMRGWILDGRRRYLGRH